MKLLSTTLLRVATVLAAIVLFASGSANLLGVQAMHASFEELGLPVWFGYFIGACEVAGAAALFFKAFSALAAGGVVVIMVGAVYYHVISGHAAQGTPALVLLVICAYICVRTRAYMLVFGQNVTR